ncbi:MAG: iron-containing alcohol dehydrogenase [Bacteroidales bacterium]|nr:iron-containing alcohol dehydrogenase [Bacteroidales bacterium]
MENFTYYNPTKLHFGRHVIENLGKSAIKYGSRAILIYGKGSIKTNGIYDLVVKELNSHNIEYTEYSGIKSNPLVDDVDSAVEQAREFGAEMVIAVGGGSVVDSGKGIALTVPSSHKAWDFYSRKEKPKKALPLLSVLTLAATGTEMNPVSVLQNHQTDQKIGYAHPLMYPAHSFLDPQNTISVNKEYTAYGIADLTAHSLEAWFGVGDASLSDRIVISIIQEAMEYGPALLNDLKNYDLRAKIMYAATLALNGLTNNGRISGDWGVHALGHEMSLLYDVPHGASLTIAYPAWLKFHKYKLNKRILSLGKHLFSSYSTDDTIKKLEEFFQKIGSPTKLSDINLQNEDKISRLLASMNTNKAQGIHHKLNDDDRSQIIELML